MGPKKRKRFLEVRKGKSKTKTKGTLSSTTLETEDVGPF